MTPSSSMNYGSQEHGDSHDFRWSIFLSRHLVCRDDFGGSPSSEERTTR